MLVSGGGTNLQALIDAEQTGVIKSGEIALVVSSRSDAYALERAKTHGIPSLIFAKKALGSQEAVEKAILAALKEYKIDMVVLAGYMNILSGSFTALYPSRILNVHPALIPSFCGEGFFGLNVHRAALDYGVKVTGATVHYVNEIPDGGQIVLQKAVDVLPGDTPEALQARVMAQAEWVILPQAVELVAKNIAEKGDYYNYL